MGPFFSRTFLFKFCRTSNTWGEDHLGMLRVELELGPIDLDFLLWCFPVFVCLYVARKMYKNDSSGQVEKGFLKGKLVWGWFKQWRSHGWMVTFSLSATSFTPTCLFYKPLAPCSNISTSLSMALKSHLLLLINPIRHKNIRSSC